MPSLLVRLDAIRHNAALIAQACLRAGTHCLPVLKTAALHPRIIQATAEGGAFRALGTIAWPGRGMSPFDGLELHHIYAPSDSLAAAMGNFSTVYVSSRYELNLLLEHCREARPALRISLECGDGRDGLLPEELDSFCHEAVRLGFPIRGLALNFACMSDRAPTLHALQEAERSLDIVRSFAPDADISAGGTDILELAGSSPLPASIGEIRCGTGIFLGVYPLSGKAIPGARHDAFSLESTVLECRIKEGRKLALCDFGHFHTASRRITPAVPGMKLHGSSSSYTVFDLSECPEDIQEGQRLHFGCDYHSLLCALSSQALPVVFTA